MTAWHRLGKRNPLPAGALTVGAGLLVAGVCTYAFLAIAGHALSPLRYSEFAAFWALLFVVAPGIFLPLEQELGRAIAARRARSDGGGPVIRRCALLGGGFLVILVIGSGIAFGAIDSHLLGGDGVLMVALLVGLSAYCSEHLARGTLSGNGRFRAYGMLLGSEGVYRVAFCAALAALHVSSPGPYGLALVAASFAAVVTAVVGERGLAAAGSHSRNSEVTTALGSLLVASMATQFMFNGGTVVVQLLASPSEQRAAGTFLNGRVLAFVPLFLFQAVTAALLPRLSALHSRESRAEFQRTLARLLMFVGALGAVAIVGAFVLGPTVLRLVFGPNFALSSRDLALLAASCTALMAAQALGQGLIARAVYRGVVAGWLAGVAGFFAVVLLVHPLLLRVELGLLGGGLAAAAVLALLQPSLWRAVPVAAA
ncbi:MAG: lipopolysaccharide biosynthesis protein [Candidatus Dormibacteria bacterium]